MSEKQQNVKNFLPEIVMRNKKDVSQSTRTHDCDSADDANVGGSAIAT
jgi:hypothetical protein